MNFIEIGSCDYDTILHSKYFTDDGWGVIVEPVLKYFKNLPRYQNVIYLNCAVTANQDEILDFYAPVEHPSPHWVKSVGSLHPNHPTLDYLGITEQTTKIQVNAISLETLYNHIPENKIHILKLDTEGTDFEILSHWDFEKFQPKQIQFETKLMSNKQLIDIKHRLQLFGYCVCAGVKKDYNQVPYNHIAVLEL